MRNQRHPLIELGLIILPIGFLSGVSIYPIYLIGVRSAKQLSWLPKAAIPEINGFICASLTFPFNFQFAYKDINSIGKQWEIANRSGKLLIVGSTLLTLATAGIANCYYMEGNLFFKLISLFVPAVSARSILVDWFLSTHLALISLPEKSSYKRTYELYRGLNVLMDNLKYNRPFRTHFDDFEGNLAERIKIASTSQQGFPGLIADINFLLDRAGDKGIIITDFQRSHPRYGLWFTLAKLAGFTGLGSLAGYNMYYLLSPKAGACIFGSGFSHYFDDPAIACPISSDTAESIGYGLGRINFGVLTAVTIFPMLALFDVTRVSLTNPWECGRTIFYVFSLLSAICRVSIATYVQTQNSGKTDDYFGLISVALVFLVFNYFTMAILGPPTFKTFAATITSAIKKLFCCAPTSEPEPMVSKISVDQTIANCQTLLHHCLFRPTEVRGYLGKSTALTHADIAQFQARASLLHPDVNTVDGHDNDGRDDAFTAFS